MGILAIIIPFIIQYGVPAAEQLYKMFSSPTAVPAQSDWDTLKTLTATTARQQMLATLAAHGIDPASPQGVALLALTP